MFAITESYDCEISAIKKLRSTIHKNRALQSQITHEYPIIADETYGFDFMKSLSQMSVVGVWTSPMAFLKVAMPYRIFCPIA